ncbi:MAG TPA: LysR family transcriptional regulator [Rickettsiales bacterium]|nr:LysR family transcriptional regulator [Rickettsiales bacterium]
MSINEDIYYKKDKLNQLRGFVNTVQCDCCSLRASKKLNLEATTVSKQVRSLERDLGIKLFTRTSSNRLILTEEGKAFYERAVVQLQGIDGLLMEFTHDFKEKEGNTLKIAGHNVVLSEILPSYLEKLLNKNEFKNLKIKLINIQKDDALKRLIEGKIDFAFYPSALNEAISVEIEKYDIFKYKNVLVLNKEHPLAKKSELTKEDLEKYPYLLSDKYTFYDPRNSLKLKPSNITFENVTLEIMLSLIKENLGITGMSDKLLNRYENLKHNFILKNVDKFLPIMYYSIYNRKSFINKKSFEFLIKLLRKDSDL